MEIDVPTPVIAAAAIAPLAAAFFIGIAKGVHLANGTPHSESLDDLVFKGAIGAGAVAGALTYTTADEGGLMGPSFLSRPVSGALAGAGYAALIYFSKTTGMACGYVAGRL